MSGTITPPTEHLKQTIKAAYEQHEALRAAIVTKFDFDFEFDTAAKNDAALKEVMDAIGDVNQGIIAAMTGYDHLVSYLKVVSELEGWETKR